MKILVGHKAPDLDVITSFWLIRKYLPGWNDARFEFVPAGQKLPGEYEKTDDQAIEKIGEDEVIHVDTGMGYLDHHQVDDDNVCAASKVLDYVLSHTESNLRDDEIKYGALRNLVEIAVNVDHFQEVYYTDPTSYLYDFTLVGILDGMKMMYPHDDYSVTNIGLTSLDALYHTFENRIWAEQEIKEKGTEFESPWGKGLGIETINDSVLKLAQKMGYVATVRKDPNNGYVRIKARPNKRNALNDTLEQKSEFQEVDVDFTQLYEVLKQKDPEAHWFLHASKRMLLNGSSKNTTSLASKLSLQEVIDAIQELK